MRSPLEAARSSYEAFARGDLDAVVADMHSEIEWHQAQGLPHGGLYRGLDEVHIVENLSADTELAVLGIFTPAGSPAAAYLPA